jgi:signal transduction histidine kinase
MQLDIHILAAMAAIAVSLVALLSNPGRNINRLFVFLSLHATLWLLARREVFLRPEGLSWLRVATAIGAFFPVHFWVIKESVVNSREGVARIARRGWLWILLSVVIGVLPFQSWFIPYDSTSVEKRWGLGYYFYTLVLILAYGILLRETVQQIRRKKGASRMELQLLLLGGGAIATGILLLMGGRIVLGDFWLVRLNPQPVAILVFYSATVVAMTTSRIFDARQLVFVGLQKISLVVGVGVIGYVLYSASTFLFPTAMAYFVTVGLSVWVFGRLNALLGRLFRFFPEATVARQAAYAASQRESKTEPLLASFVSILRGWGQSERAIILYGVGDVLSSCGIEVQKDADVVVGMRKLRWASPERLLRERESPEGAAVADFLREHSLGVVVIAEGPALTTLIGVGVGASRRPYTYPQVMQLMELASIMESALERAHFSAKVQHTEQLATVGLLGASLAHEIRNPLVSIKTFVQLLPTHYQDARFREKFFHLIGSEVTRIDQLTEQLLDLASPRTYAAAMHALHSVLQPGIELVAAKAADKNVQFLTDFQASPDLVCTDPAAAKQVLLNLCFNAIQAVDEHRVEGERWVRLTTRNTPAGVEMAVADNGPGIAPEIQQRLFQPFQTTKSTGFGLGLAICRDILANLGASISVDPPVSGQGATFRVIYPCQVSSS